MKYFSNILGSGGSVNKGFDANLHLMSFKSKHGKGLIARWHLSEAPAALNFIWAGIVPFLAPFTQKIIFSLTFCHFY